MKDLNNPLVNKQAQMEKFPGKGGWTFVRLPEVDPSKNNPFGWKKVKGFIDHVEIRQYHLMPIGDGRLFLPVKAAIRKEIKKEAGDWVQVVLYEDNDPIEIPKEFITCLKDEPKAWKNFQQLPERKKKKYVDWIYTTKTDDLKVERMAQAINELGNL